MAAIQSTARRIKRKHSDPYQGRLPFETPRTGMPTALGGTVPGGTGHGGAVGGSFAVLPLPSAPSRSAVAPTRSAVASTRSAVAPTRSAVAPAGAAPLRSSVMRGEPQVRRIVLAELPGPTKDAGYPQLERLPRGAVRVPILDLLGTAFVFASFLFAAVYL